MNNPRDPEARSDQEDGSTHFAHKAEQAVDLDTGAMVAITTHGGATGDTTSLEETLPAAGLAVAEQIGTPTAQGPYKLHAEGLCEVVTDKGHHSGPSWVALREVGVRSYVSVPKTATSKVEPQSRTASRRSCEPTPCGRRTGQAVAEASRGISGASVCALI